MPTLVFFATVLSPKKDHLLLTWNIFIPSVPNPSLPPLGCLSPHPCCCQFRQGEFRRLLWLRIVRRKPDQTNSLRLAVAVWRWDDHEVRSRFAHFGNIVRVKLPKPGTGVFIFFSFGLLPCPLGLRIWGTLSSQQGSRPLVGAQPLPCLTDFQYESLPLWSEDGRNCLPRDEVFLLGGG